ncbi:MAG: hypothetical protein IJB81_00100 [Clostridia bacterium]|nr:hypothetical protein [Clostridia bacterium]
MRKHYSPVFSAFFIAVLLLCSITVAVSVFHQASLSRQINEAQRNLRTMQGRLLKQEMEFAEVLEAIPAAQAELAVLQPQAQAAYDQEQALRQQRKELRAENASLAAALEVLQAQTFESNSEAAATAEAILRLEQALTELRALDAQLD